jgi:YVTN family beta-propeller protein
VVACAIGAPKEMEFRVLGSLEVVDDDGSVALGAPKQRTLLAVLLLHRGEPVSADRLIDEIWGERPPASANKIVQGYVSNLRKLIGDGRLVTQRRGYVLRIEPGQTDVDRFEALAVEGRRALEGGDALTAGAVLREALALWRGPALADFAYQPFAQAEIARLEESRLVVLEDRIDADLASGEHARLVGELEALVREHPVRERLQGQLMLALYRSGRQAGALETYRTARDRLVDELGLEPGPGLKELERAILAQDPALSAPRRRTVRQPRTMARARWRGGLLIAAGGALLLVVAVAVAVKLSESGESAVTVAGNSLAAIDPASDRVVAAVALGTRPGAVVFGSGSLWTANPDDRTVSRLNPATMRVQQIIPVGGPPTGIAAAGGGLWVVQSNVNPDANTISVAQIDPEYDSLGSAVPIGNVIPDGPGAVAAWGNSVWVAPSTGLLTRLNAVTGAVIPPRIDPTASPAGIAITPDGAIWLTDSEADEVQRIDPTGLPMPIPVGNTPTAIAAGAGSVWVVDSLDDEVVRIDQSSQSVIDTISVGDSPAGIAVGDGSVWVANAGDGTVTRINPANDHGQTIHVGGRPTALTVADGRAWVAVDAQSIPPSRSGPSGGTLRIVSGKDVDSMDPALAANNLSAQLLYATCAKLLNYPDKAGAAGSQLTPEVAEALPTRSPNGKTYTFTIRRGFRFSPPNDQPVTAQTFRYTIERTLNHRTGSYSDAFFGDIVGADAYMAGRATDISGVTVSGNNLIIRLRAPAPDFLARIAMPAFCAVPTNTPVKSDGEPVIPSAGPYYVAPYPPGQGVVLVRNPNYHGSRPHHFGRIQLTVGVPAQRAVSAIEARNADYTTLGGDEYNITRGIAALTSGLAPRFGPGSAAAAHGRQQYFVTPPALQLDYFDLNTHRSLFSDVRVRQAVNFAIDRRTLAAVGSGFQALPDTPTDHYLPPGIPGYRSAHVYPLAPDLAKARQLIAAAHAAGRTAVLYTFDSYPGPELAQIVKNDLARIGLQVQFDTFPIRKFYSLLATPGAPFDLAYSGWIADYPDPDDFLNFLLDNSLWGPPLKDPVAQRELAAAARLSGPERYLTYGALDLTLARDVAPWAAFGNGSSHDFFSARIGCQTFGIYGMDLAALCTRPSSPR